MVQPEYFDWLLFQVEDHERPELAKISILLHELAQYEFRITIHSDLPRVSDAEVLRERYLSECQPRDISLEPISILEVMVALAIRCENEMMWDPVQPYKPYRWILVMVNSMELGEYRNDIWQESCIKRSVAAAVQRLYCRDFEPNGRGSLFAVSNPCTDFRTIGIWSQMNNYLVENLGL